MGAKLAIYEIERLTAERDEMQGELRKAETESSMLRVECGVIAAERDEARRHLCDLYVKGQPSSSNMTDQDYAAELGWDCFKEDGK
jgi:hypothetical protein